MASTKPKKEAPPTPASTLAIGGEMNIYRAAELKALLLGALDKASVLEVDLAGVTELDSAGVQLLILTKRVAQASQRTLRLVAHSQAVIEIFEMLDLGAYFGDALVMSSSTTAAARS